jgi:hypothetical protein
VQQLVLAEGSVVFDPKVEPHHHFVDDETGTIHDIPWTALRVGKVDELEGFDVRDYMVVVRGRKKAGQAAADRTRPRRPEPPRGRGRATRLDTIQDKTRSNQRENEPC